MSIKIIYSDEMGGVKTVSEAISYSLNKNNINNKIFNLKDVKGNFFIRAFKVLNKFVGNKDSVFLLQHFDAIFLGFFLRFLGCSKLVNVVHTDLLSYYESNGFFKKTILRFVFFLLKNQIVIFVSKEAEVKARKKFKLKKTSTIYNVFDFDVLSKPERQKSINIVLGSISRLHASKNIDLIIRVLKRLNDRALSVSLLIYGSGEEYASLAKYINSQGCEQFIKLVGRSNNKEEMFGSIDALISFSSVEGLPTVILEAINHGKPIIYTDCSSGPRELMLFRTDPMIKTTSFEKSSVGYLVKPVVKPNRYSKTLSFYEEEYVSILEQFIDDVRKQRFSMEYDITPFSEQIIVRQWLDLIGSFK